MIFDFHTIESIQYYVYCLIDPRNNIPFYIGKGKGNRVFNHANDALETTVLTDKLNIIREIINSGSSVDHVIIRHNLDEKTAFIIESSLIDFMNYLEFKTKNITLGHESNTFGIMSTDEIIRKYQSTPLTKIGNDCVIININKMYERAKGTKNYYQATKESWRIADKRIPNIRYVLSEYKGYIVDVFEVQKGGWYKVVDHKGKMRWGFDGERAPREILDLYLNRKFLKKQGSANPVFFKIPGT